MKRDRKSVLLPKLRFPEFRDAEGWATKPMRDIYTFKGNNSLSREKLNYELGSLKNIHYGDIHTRFSTHFDIKKERVPYINPFEPVRAFKAENFCVEGDMIFADASEDLKDIGKAIEIVNLNGEMVVSGLHTILARQTKSKLILGFGGHLFKSKWVRTQIQKESQGAKVLGLSGGRLAKMEIPFPHSPREQQKIADCLSSLDELIAAQARKVDAHKTHKKAMLQQLFPREGETQPRLRFPEFRNAGNWRKVVAGEIFSNRVERGEANLPIYSVTMTDGMVPRASLDRRIDDIAKSSANKKVHKGDIAYNMMRMWQGALGVAPEDCMVSPAYIVLKPKAANTFFFSFLLKLPQMLQVLTGRSRGLTEDRLRLYYDDFAKVLLRCPLIEEQNCIADFLSSLDSLIAIQAKELEKLRAHKKGLMQQLFPSTESVEA